MLYIPEKHFNYEHCLDVPKLYIDLDDTLSDFSRYFCHKFLKDLISKKHSVDEINSYNYYKNLTIRKYMNKRMSNQRIDFWSRIPPTTNGTYLWNNLKMFKPYVLIGVLPNDIGMELGKIKWIRRRFRWKNNIKNNSKLKNEIYSELHRISINADKTKIAVSSKGIRNILIDDSLHACEAWEEAGGIAYLYDDNVFVVERIINSVVGDMNNQTNLDFLLQWNQKLQRYVH